MRRSLPGAERVRPAAAGPARHLGGSGPGRATWDGLLGYLRDRGPLRTFEAALCVAVWLERYGGRPQRAGGVRGRDVRRAYPAAGHAAAGLPVLRPAEADALRRAAAFGLLARQPGGGYTVTPLGAAVADALPDRARVGRLRALKATAPRPATHAARIVPLDAPV